MWGMMVYDSIRAIDFYDRLTPNKGLDIINEELKKVYKKDGAEECFELKKYPVAHLETAEMRAEVIKFLIEWI